MLKKIYLLAGVTLLLFATALFFLLTFLAAGFSRAGIFSEVHPFGAIVLFGVIAVAGFYLLKIGFVSAKNYFR